MNRALTLFLFVICAVGVAAAAGQRQGSSNVGNDVAIKSFTLTASDGVNKDLFGLSVAISGDTVVVGAGDAKKGKGAAYVFVKPPSGWKDMTQTAELRASDGQAGDLLGGSVAISGDTIVVGAAGASVNGTQGQGAAYIFVKPAGGWQDTTETAKLTASNGSAYSGFGQAVSISGNTVVVGAPQAEPNFPGPGAAYIFVEPLGGWSNMNETAELSASDATQDDDFGISVSINANTVVIGAFQASCSCDAGPGAAYVFVEPEGGWTNMTETAKLKASDGMIGDQFGVAVSVSGGTIAVGAPEHNAGRAYVFVEPPNGWVNMRQTAELKNNVSGSCFGNSVSLYGTELLVGAQCTQNSNGAAFLFLKPATGWHDTSSYNAVLTIHFSFPRDNFATSLAIQGKTAVVGAQYAPTTPPCCTDGPGQAFIFTTQ